MTECQLLINTPVHPTPADNEVVSIQMLNGGGINQESTFRPGALHPMAP